MTALLDQARSEGYKAISLSVAKDSPAIGLYERYGFARVDERDGAVTMSADLSDAG